MFDTSYGKDFDFDSMYDIPDSVKKKANYEAFKKLTDDKVNAYHEELKTNPQGIQIFLKIWGNFEFFIFHQFLFFSLFQTKIHHILSLLIHTHS